MSGEKGRGVRGVDGEQGIVEARGMHADNNHRYVPFGSVLQRIRAVWTTLKAGRWLVYGIEMNGKLDRIFNLDAYRISVVAASTSDYRLRSIQRNSESSGRREVFETVIES